ncbi:hypothetical protein QUF90_25030 [Desulfococcaceae bacterium HSG9]|nr:hypothetical protein [Desulfococcaceae bacterium HSG9]
MADISMAIDESAVFLEKIKAEKKIRKRYVIWEQTQAAVDMPEHRLIPQILYSVDGKSRSAKIKHSDFLHPVPEKACGFRLRQKTASLNFCAPCHIFRHFPSTDINMK